MRNGKSWQWPALDCSCVLNLRTGHKTNQAIKTLCNSVTHCSPPRSPSEMCSSSTMERHRLWCVLQGDFIFHDASCFTRVFWHLDSESWDIVSSCWIYWINTMIGWSFKNHWYQASLVSWRHRRQVAGSWTPGGLLWLGVSLYCNCVYEYLICGYVL